MNHQHINLAITCLLLVALVSPALACTTILVGKKASTDGSVLVSPDGGMNDARRASAGFSSCVAIPPGYAPTIRESPVAGNKVSRC